MFEIGRRLLLYRCGLAIPVLLTLPDQQVRNIVMPSHPEWIAHENHHRCGG